MKTILLLFFPLCLAGCLGGPRVAIAPGHETMVHNKIALAPIPDGGGGAGSGSLATNEFLRGLMQSGVKVKILRGGDQDALMKQAKDAGFDYLIVASYTRYLPERKYLVNQAPGQTTVYLQGSPTELSGSGTTTRPVGGIGSQGQQILISNATVGLTAQMLQASTGDVIWTSAYTYEGVDVQQATESVVEDLLRTLPGPKK